MTMAAAERSDLRRMRNLPPPRQADYIGGYPRAACRPRRHRPWQRTTR